MKITRIEVQKKNKKRYNLYSDEVFLFGIGEDTLVRFGISAGRDYSESQLQEFQQHDEVSRCLSQAYRFLSRRAHLQAELKRKLIHKDFSPAVIEAAFDYLRKQKYLNDHEFIEMFIREEVHLKKSGPLLIRKKLFEKGAQAAETDAILSKMYSENLQIENAAALMEKKLSTMPGSDAAKTRQKLAAYLNGKGFEWSIINTVLADITG